MRTDAVPCIPRIKVRVSKDNAGRHRKTGFVESTLGTIYLQRDHAAGSGLCRPYAVRKTILKLEVDFHVGKKQLKQILEKVINTHGATKTAEVLDDIKAIGYKYSTRAAMTVSISDMTVPAQKAADAR